MTKKRIVSGLVVFLFAASPFGFAADPIKKGKTVAAILPNQATFDKISEKLDKLLKTQDDILKQLEEMKKELYIIKVRASH